MFKNKFPMVPRKTPVIDFLSNRPTLVLGSPVIRRLNYGFSSQTYLPPGVSHEEAVEIIKEAWGKKLAAGMADRAGLTGVAREQFIENWSTVVSEGLLK